MVKRGKHVAKRATLSEDNNQGRKVSTDTGPPSTKIDGKKVKITTKRLTDSKDEADDKDHVTYKDVGMGMMVLGLILLLMVIVFSAFDASVWTEEGSGITGMASGSVVFGISGLCLMLIGGMVLLYPRWSRKL